MEDEDAIGGSGQLGAQRVTHQPGSPRVTLRACVPEDEPFLLRVYRSTREPELAATGWTEEEKRAFVAMQFSAQAHHYREHYPGATFAVIEVGGAPAGRLYLHRRERELRIMDIALLPEFRGRGIGSGLLRALVGEAAAEGRSVSIHVERFNRALRLYERLGFRVAADRGVYLLLERPAAQLG